MQKRSVKGDFHQSYTIFTLGIQTEKRQQNNVDVDHMLENMAAGL